MDAVDLKIVIQQVPLPNSSAIYNYRPAAHSATTPKSWVISRIDVFVSASVFHQVKNLSLYCCHPMQKVHLL